MIDVGTEVRSRQMKFLPPVGDDVTEDDESSGVGHLEKVTSRKTTSVLLSGMMRGKGWSRHKTKLLLLR